MTVQGWRLGHEDQQIKQCEIINGLKNLSVKWVDSSGYPYEEIKGLLAIKISSLFEH